MGFPLGRIRARQVTAAMIESSDLVLVMEAAHAIEVNEMTAAGDLSHGIFILGSFFPPEMSGDAAIPDPYYGDWQGFLAVFDRVDRALDGVVSHIQRQPGLV